MNTGLFYCRGQSVDLTVPARTSAPGGFYAHVAGGKQQETKQNALGGVFLVSNRTRQVSNSDLGSHF